MASRVVLFLVLFCSLARSTAAQAVRRDPPLSQCPVLSSCYFESDTKADTLLIRAAHEGDLAEVRRLLNIGASPKARQKDGLVWSGFTALCLAVESSTGFWVDSPPLLAYRHVIGVLIDNGAEARDCSVSGVRDAKALSSLLAHGADPNAGVISPIASALAQWPTDPKNQTTIIAILLQAGADPNTKGQMGQNMLFSIPHGPSPSSKPPITDAEIEALFRLFVRFGIRINDTASYIGDRECGFEAVSQSGKQYCQTFDPSIHNCHAPLVECGDRLKRFDTGKTALMYAVLGPSDFLVKLLLSAGADPSLKDADGCSALDDSVTPAIHELIAERLRQGGTGVQETSTCKPSQGVSFRVSPRPSSPAKPAPRLTLDKIDLLCYRGPGAWRTETNADASTEFGSKRVLNITISDSARLLMPRATAEIVRETLFAIALWRRMCTLCTISNAAVVIMSGKTYVDERLGIVAESFDFDKWAHGNTSLLDESEGPNSNTLAGIYLDARLSQMVPLASYHEINWTDHSFERLCSTAREDLPLEFLGIRDACPPSGNSKPGRALLQIKVLDGPTKCGGSTAIIGCESSDSSSIELNAHDYQFVEHGTSKPIFGRGEDKADLQILILHETGHWAGIADHLASAKNIMSETIDDCVCINQADISQLARSTRPVRNERPFALLDKRPDRVPITNR